MSAVVSFGRRRELLYLLRQYGIALGAALIALALHSAIEPLVQGSIPFLLFVPTALVVALTLGRGPALLVVAIGAIRAVIVWTGPASSPPPEAVEFAHWLSILFFMAVGILISWFGARVGNDAAQATSVLRDTRDQLRQQVDDLERLHELTTRLVSGGDLRVQLQSVLETLAAFHGVRQGWLSIYQPSTRTMEIVVSLGLSAEALARLRAALLGEGVCGLACRERRRVVVEDTESDPSFAELRDVAAHEGFRAVHSTPLMSRDGEILGVISVQFPAPRLPDAREQRLADMCAQEAALLVERERALAALIEARQHEEQMLKEADRRKDEFLATLAHELRNPLAPIRQAAAISMFEGASAEQKSNSHAIIDRQVRHMARLLDDLLDVSRITRGALELRRQRVDLRSVVQAACEVAQPLIDSYNHALDLKLPERSFYIDVDPLRISQVLSNLLTNAAKYTPSGGSIAVRAEVLKAEIVIEVSDDGIGIRPEALPTLFQMFARGDPASRHSAGGLGIGLGLAKGLVELHGGTITAQSAGPGSGSRFTVRLPIVAAAPAARAAKPAPVFRTVKALRILVADDNADAADTLAELLRLHGHEVTVANDGEEAIEAFERVRPEVALLDIGMPKKSGYEVAQWIRAQPQGREVTLAAITGWGQSADKARAEKAGFDRHLTKPIDYDELAALLSVRYAPPASASGVV